MYQVHKQFKTMKAAISYKHKTNNEFGGNYIILSSNDSKIFVKKEKELKMKLNKLLKTHKQQIKKLYMKQKSIILIE